MHESEISYYMYNDPIQINGINIYINHQALCSLLLAVQSPWSRMYLNVYWYLHWSNLLVTLTFLFIHWPSPNLLGSWLQLARMPQDSAGTWQHPPCLLWLHPSMGTVTVIIWVILSQNRITVCLGLPLASLKYPNWLDFTSKK